jgi:hypothetical protein
VERASLVSRSGWRATRDSRRELEAPREEDAPHAQAVPGLNDEREPREAAEGQLGEARVGARHVREQRHARRKVVVARNCGARGTQRAQAVLGGGGGGGEDGVLEANALAAPKVQHLLVDGLQVAARERVEEL